MRHPVLFHQGVLSGLELPRACGVPGLPMRVEGQGCPPDLFSILRVIHRRERLRSTGRKGHRTVYGPSMTMEADVKNKIAIAVTAVTLSMAFLSGSASAAHLSNLSKDDCKQGGFAEYQRVNGDKSTAFKNQGDCIQFVNTGK